MIKLAHIPLTVRFSSMRIMQMGLIPAGSGMQTLANHPDGHPRLTPEGTPLWIARRLGSLLSCWPNHWNGWIKGLNVSSETPHAYILATYTICLNFVNSWPEHLIEKEMLMTYTSKIFWSGTVSPACALPISMATVNTYGTNILMLKYVAGKAWAMSVDIVSLQTSFDPDAYDIAFFGGGQDYRQTIVSGWIKDLERFIQTMCGP